MSRCLHAAERLQVYLRRHHWRGGALMGPDPIGKVHWRLTRFVRNWLPSFVPEDQYVFYQGLAYWLLAHLSLEERDPGASALDLARQTADYLTRTQRSDGAWDYPNLYLRRGKLATVEGAWAAIGLVRAHRRLGDRAHLEAAIRWHRCMTEVIGYSWHDGVACVNYYDEPVGMIPNNATIALWLNAELATATGDSAFMEMSGPQIQFLERAQLPSGELPYAWRQREHLFCYQYNSFEYLDLMEYYDLTGEPRVNALASRLAKYLRGGVTELGACRRDCGREYPDVDYWALALATALARARLAGHVVADDEVRRGRELVLSRQRSDGGFDFSRREFGFLRDRRSYPRYLAMMLYHLLLLDSMESCA